MKTVTVRTPGDEGVQIRVEWAGGEATVHLPGEQSGGSATLNPDGEGVLRLRDRVVSFFAVRVGEELHLWIEGEVYRFPAQAERRGRSAHGGGADLPPGGEVTAPMPGVVRKIVAEAGTRVAAKDPLVILESMKMELTVPSPSAGTVKEILCEPGSMVDVGTVLLRLEPEGAS